MSKKKRLGIGKLRRAGKLARELLVKKGLLAEKSIVDELENSQSRVKLPGLPAYIPQEETLKQARRMVYDLLIIWADKTKSDENKQENIALFFKFLIEEIRKIQRKAKKEQREMATKIENSIENSLTLEEIFSSTHLKETTGAMIKFFVDSLAIAVIVKSNNSTSEFVTWFLDWTGQLLEIWKTDDIGEKSTVS